MKQWILVSCLLGICSAVPILPQFPGNPGIPGMGSLSLETMRQLSGSNMPNALSQAYSFADPFHPVWMHNFLPRHSSFYWIGRRPREHETQRCFSNCGSGPTRKVMNQFQYEYSMPVHPPPLPSQQTPFLPQQPGIQDQKPYQFINFLPTKQVQLQQNEAQPPFQQNFPFPEGNQPTIQQQLPPTDKQKQQIPVQENTGTLGNIFPGLQGAQPDPAQKPQQGSIYPGLYYMPYMANQGVPGAPGRLGIVSSEEMQGGGFGASPYQAMGPNLLPMGSGFGNMPPKTLGQPGDFTVEDDQLGITEQPEVQGGANPGPNPSGTGINIVPLDGTQGSAFPNANSHLQNPASQSKGPSGVPQGTVSPLATQGFPEGFIPFGADSPMPLDPTMFPDTIYTTNVGNGGGQPQGVPDGWHFQEP